MMTNFFALFDCFTLTNRRHRLGFPWFNHVRSALVTWVYGHPDCFHLAFVPERGSLPVFPFAMRC